MPFVKKKDIDFYIEDRKIILSDEYLKNSKRKFKKITGSRLFNVLNLNPMSSSFKTWCQMVNIYQEPMDEMIANAGNIIEPKIRAFVEKKLNCKYLSYDPKKINFDLFIENSIFGGIPDGEPLVDNKINYNNFPMLEIKTTSIDNFLYKKINGVFKLQYDENNLPIVKSFGTKKQKWFDLNNQIIIPGEYLFQLGLYCYLKNVNKGLFAICFLEYKDYLFPEQCDVNNRDIELIECKFDLSKFDYWIKKAKQWYEKHILTGISPEMTNDDINFVNEVLGE